MTIIFGFKGFNQSLCALYVLYTCIFQQKLQFCFKGQILVFIFYVLKSKILVFVEQFCKYFSFHTYFPKKENWSFLIFLYFRFLRKWEKCIIVQTLNWKGAARNRGNRTQTASDLTLYSRPVVTDLTFSPWPFDPTLYICTLSPWSMCIPGRYVP